METQKLLLKCKSYYWNAKVTIEMQKLLLKCKSYYWNANVTIDSKDSAVMYSNVQ